MPFRLVAENSGEAYQLSEGTTLVVGRGSGCDVMVLNPNISRRHAELRVGPDSVALKDLGSSNGTFINGEREREGRARAGDVITFGTAPFRLERVESPSGVADTTAPERAERGVPPPSRPARGTRVRPLEGLDVRTIVSGLAAAAESPSATGESHAASPSLRRRLDALLAIAAELLSERDVAGIMHRVAEQGVSLLRADRMAVLLLDRTGALVQAVARAADGGDVARMVPQSIARRALEEKVAILTDDAAQDLRFTGESVRMQLVRSAMCVPLHSDAGALGVLYADSITEGRTFGEEDLELILAFSGIVAAAVGREKLSEQLRREAVVRSGFERYFAPALAARIAAEPEQVPLGGERRTVAVLFSDIRGFSAWSEQLPAEETAGILSEYFSEMVECVFATGGTLDKFIGDALMAQWGAPLSTGGDAANALAAARLMHERLAALNERWSAEKKPVLSVGIGIGYGEVFAGNIGSNRRLEYTVIGDVVNVTSRLAALAAPGEVLISEDARDAMGSDLRDAEELDQLQVRGRTRNVRIFRVHLTRDAPRPT